MSTTIFARNLPTTDQGLTNIRVLGSGNWTLDDNGVTCNLPFQASLSGMSVVFQPSLSSVTLNSVVVHSTQEVSIIPGAPVRTFLAWAEVCSGPIAVDTLSVHGKLNVSCIISQISPDLLNLSVTGNAYLSLIYSQAITSTVIQCTGNSQIDANTSCATADITVWGTSGLNYLKVSDSLQLSVRGVSTAQLTVSNAASVTQQKSDKSSIQLFYN